MKCIAAVVMVALAATVQAGIVVPSAYNAIPSVYSVPTSTVVQQNVVPKYVTAYSAPVVAPYATYAAAPAITYAAHGSVAYAAPTAYAYNQAAYVPTVYAPVQKEATYVAATRGAIHEAPLVGHAINQKSLNIEPAPGTL